MQPLMHLLQQTVQFASDDRLLILNSAADPLLHHVAHQFPTVQVLLAEDNVAVLADAQRNFPVPPRHVPFHNYLACVEMASCDSAIMNLSYQPANAWIHYGLHIARRALRPGGRLYIAGPKDRGIQTIARHMQEIFGNMETLTIHKGHRVICSRQPEVLPATRPEQDTLDVFAGNRLDEGTRLLLDVLSIHATDYALDLGCGAGYIGLHIAQQARHVVMVDVSLAAVAASQQAINQSKLAPIEVYASDSITAIREQRFDLVATNPPFHQGGIQTADIAERFIQDAASVLRPQGRFYLVANRFLKYEPCLRKYFRRIEEIGGNNRYKIVYARLPIS